MAKSNSFSMTPVRLPSINQLTAVVIVISSVAWLLMVLMHGSQHVSFQLGHHGVGDGQWLTGWFIMVLAMMLPPALPFLQTMLRSTQGLPHQQALLVTTAVVFIATWTATGIALVAMGHVLTRLGGTMPWLVDRPTVVSGLAALLVGIYQLSPVKEACLTACRSPTAMLLLLWDDDAPWRSAVVIGLRYAAVCVGCCWTLMLLTLIVGAFVLPLMVVVSVIMLLERLLPSVRPLVPLQAAFACALGILLLLGSLPPGLALEGTGQPIHPHHSTPLLDR